MNDKSLFFNSIHPDDKEHFYDSMHKMLTTGSSESEFRVFHKDGTIRYLQGTAHLKKGDVDEFDICSGITVDITELRTAEADLVKKANEISAQNETLKEIAWIHSHKVRSEIATILGLIQLFKYNDSTDEENMTILEGIKKESTNLDAITREINEKAQPLRHLK
jgi:PAS fold